MWWGHVEGGLESYMGPHGLQPRETTQEGMETQDPLLPQFPNTVCPGPPHFSAPEFVCELKASDKLSSVLPDAQVLWQFMTFLVLP